MQTATHHSTEARQAAKAAASFPTLTTETRTHVPTDCAAHWLMRRPQTMRGYACREDGPLRPIRVNGRLGWAVADIRKLLGVA